MKYRVTLNNRVYEVEVEAGEAVLLDEYEATLPQSPAPAAAAEAAPKPQQSASVSFDGDVVKAPMPGTVLKIAIAVGQKVSEGDTLLTIEAMKMENEVASDKSGTVSKILVQKGQTLETGTPLAVIS